MVVIICGLCTHHAHLCLVKVHSQIGTVTLNTCVHSQTESFILWATCDPLPTLFNAIELPSTVTFALARQARKRASVSQESGERGATLSEAKLVPPLNTNSQVCSRQTGVDWISSAVQFAVPPLTARTLLKTLCSHRQGGGHQQQQQ